MRGSGGRIRTSKRALIAFGCSLLIAACGSSATHRWLTVVSPENPQGTELVLEPDAHPAVKPFKDALVRDGIPFTSFAVSDIAVEFERLRALGVRFTQEPADLGPVTAAVFDDRCGNLIQIAQER